MIMMMMATIIFASNDGINGDGVVYDDVDDGWWWYWVNDYDIS